MDDQYDLFARFYHKLIATSGHLRNEQATVLNIVSKLCLSRDDKILDVACGTGAALHFLYHHGYIKLYGLDFSNKMLEEAKRILPNIPFYHNNWNSLISEPELEGQFDLVLVISVSILHISSVLELETVLHSFRGLLKDNGVLVIDNRVWQNSENGLVEENRKVNQSNFICKCNIGDKEYKISDNCYYCNERQFVEYKIKSDNFTQVVKVSYLRITTSAILEILYRMGFNKVTTEFYDTWPYELIYAHK